MDISSIVLQENTKLILKAAGQPELRKIKALEGGFVNNNYLIEHFWDYVKGKSL